MQVFNSCIIFILDGVRLYSCDICGERFRERIVLMIHKDVNHPQSVSDESVKRSHHDIFNKSGNIPTILFFVHFRNILFLDTRYD